MAEQIKTIEGVIDSLGGVETVAILIGSNPKAVYQWKRRGIPANTFYALTGLLNAKGLYAPPSLWNMKGTTS